MRCRPGTAAVLWGEHSIQCSLLILDAQCWTHSIETMLMGKGMAKAGSLTSSRDVTGKGRRLGKKKLQEVTEIKISDIQRVNLHLDI